MEPALSYPAGRYAYQRPPDLTSRSERKRLSGPALRAFFSIMTRWQVRDEDARVRRAKTYRFTWKGTLQPTVTVER